MIVAPKAVDAQLAPRALPLGLGREWVVNRWNFPFIRGTTSFLVTIYLDVAYFFNLL